MHVKLEMKWYIVNCKCFVVVVVLGVVCQPDNCDRKIPLLSTLFEAFPDVPINIDIKYDSDELIEKVSCIFGTHFSKRDVTQGVWIE